MTLEKIISIEDNDDHFEIINFYLKSLCPSLVVERYSDGEMAMASLDMVREAPPSIFLLDINLPKFSGLEVLAKIKACDELKYSPVIIYTTSSSHKDLEAAYGLGVNSYFTKSMDPQGIKGTMKLILDYWSNNETPSQLPQSADK